LAYLPITFCVIFPDMLTAEIKNSVLHAAARLLDVHREDILRANALDIAAAASLDATLRDRLLVSGRKIDGMIAALRLVAAAEDPENRLLSSYTHPNGMSVENRSVAFGNVLIIYESRPDVTVEAAASAFKAGNRIYLKGGKEARNTNLVLVDLWHRALADNGLETGWVTYLDLDRESTQNLLRANTLRLDLIIPRGGEALIHFVKTHTEIPVLVSGRGNNFVYIAADADISMAIALVLNGKSRLSVCNATDKVLFDRAIPGLETVVNRMVTEARNAGLHPLADETVHAIVPATEPVTGIAVWDEEFLSEKILFAVTPGPGSAIETINRHSGGHSAAIVTADAATAAHFMNAVDCAAVYHNASTRFTDGGEFGLAAEMAISTQKLHFRGPVGLGQLVTNKWFVKGNGQTR
jgi:glutamate-5-semialdehyde dehydrogenase